MAKDREYYRVLVRDRFYKLSAIIERAVKAKDVYRARLAELNGQSYKGAYTPEHLAKLKEDAGAAVKAVNAELHTEFVTQLGELQAALSESHSQLDLSSPALINAVNLIKSLGKNLDFDQAAMINAPFLADQNALRFLQTAYKSAGVTLDGGLDKQIYNAGDAVREIGQYAESALKSDGSLNNLASKIGSIAKLEGVEFEALPDPAAVQEAVFRGAGLPAEGA